MKKKFFLCMVACFTLTFTCSCSLFDSSSKEQVSTSQNSIEEPKSDTPSETQKNNSSSNTESENSNTTDTDKDTNSEPESSNESKNGTSINGDSSLPNNADSSNSGSSTNSNEEEASPSIQTTVGYVLSCDGNIIYADLKNTGSRLYPGEGENRKVAFDISNAEQIQTNISEFNPVNDNLICPGIQVTIEYYVENGMNIATKLTSDGDGKEPYSPVAIGKVSSVSDTELIILVTEGDNIGETITFNLSVCDPILDPISVDSQVAIAYYTKQDINYAIYVGCVS